MKILYLDTFAGIAGDMFLGLLLDLGVDPDRLAEGLGRLPMKPIGLSSRRESRLGIGGSRVEFRFPAAVQYRHWRDIDQLLSESDLEPENRELARRIFKRIATAEAAVHGVSPEDVHFHEVGALDSIADVVGAAVGLRLLGVERVVCSPLPMSRGLTETAHGPFPLPAPATLELLRGLPVTDAGCDQELVTPTGAAIVAEVAAFEPWPRMRVEKIGYGVGTRDLSDRPNLLRGVVGETSEPDLETDRVAVLEAHIDDGNPEWLGLLMERLLDAGAADVAFAPLQMKKNRPGTRITVICSPEQASPLARQILRESSSIGVRWYEADRFKLDRRSAEIETPWGAATVKLLYEGKELVRAVPEFESCRRLAEKSGRPLPEVYRTAERAAAEIFFKSGTPCGD